MMIFENKNLLILKYSLIVSLFMLLLLLTNQCTIQQNNNIFSNVDSIILSAIQDSVFPGAVLFIGNKHNILYKKAYGYRDYSENAWPVKTSTLFDLASLTKVIATTSAIMKLYEQQKLDLNAAVANYIPQFAQNGKADVTIRNLLLHNSGFPAGKPFYKFCKTEQEAYDSLYAMPLRYKTGTKTIYSDLGFITLGKIVETISKEPLEVFIHKNFFTPLRMKDTMFNPHDLWIRIAPTEPEYNYRMTKKTGKPKNKITQLMGGVAGHAGLFSSAEDLSRIALLFLNKGVYNGKSYLNKSTIKLFNTRQSENSTRALGWDTGNGNPNRQISHLFSESAFGHTGFTGTSIWMDPELNLFVILLTNRTYEMTDRNEINRIRPLVHDEIIRSISN
jgi:CubicO group peptidase (beta-lactamase class C family)